MLHGLEFLVLSFLLLNIFKKNKYFYAIVVSFLVNTGLEGLQLLISYRKFNPYDILAGLIGSLLILGVKFFRKW